jgi:putative endonuclease
MAEELVAERLRGTGWEVIEQNARTRHGEIDIVARDRSSLVFVEVKASRAASGPFPGTPELAVGRRKQLRLRRLAAAWLAERGWRGCFGEVRFDVVAVTFAFDGAVQRYEHIHAAF